MIIGLLMAGMTIQLSYLAHFLIWRDFYSHVSKLVCSKWTRCKMLLLLLLIEMEAWAGSSHTHWWNLEIATHSYISCLNNSYDGHSIVHWNIDRERVWRVWEREWEKESERVSESGCVWVCKRVSERECERDRERRDMNNIIIKKMNWQWISLSLSHTISISFIRRQIVPRSAARRRLRRSAVYPLPSQRIKARSVSIPGKSGSLPRPSRPCVAEIRLILSNSTGMTKPSATSNASDVGSVVDQSGRGLMQHSHVTKDWNYHTQMSTEQWK